MTGFVAIHRDMLSHPLLQDPVRLRAWLWLIANAAWKPTRIKIKGEIVTLERGQLSYSVRFLAENWGMSKSAVGRFMTALRAEGMIETCSKSGTPNETTAGQGQAVITVCNYAKYQDVGESERDNSGTAGGTTAGQQRDKEEQVNKETREPKGSQRACAQKPDEVSDQVWRDFITMRRAKRAPLTETALKAITREAAKARWPLDSALRECVTRGWQGFKADWVTGAESEPVVPI